MPWEQKKLDVTICYWLVWAWFILFWHLKREKLVRFFLMFLFGLSNAKELWPSQNCSARWPWCKLQTWIFSHQICRCFFHTSWIKPIEQTKFNKWLRYVKLGNLLGFNGNQIYSHPDLAASMGLNRPHSAPFHHFFLWQVVGSQQGGCEQLWVLWHRCLKCWCWTHPTVDSSHISRYEAMV